MKELGHQTNRLEKKRLFFKGHNFFYNSLNLYKFHKGKMSNFTLIELLVVISIIVILMSMLLPALQKVREKTKEIACANNMKQMGVAIFAYANDYQEQFPVSCLATETNWWENYWHWKMRSYVNALNNDFVVSTKKHYNNGKCLYYCPSDKETTNLTTSYIYVAIFQPNYHTYGVALKKIRFPASIAILTDGYLQTSDPSATKVDLDNGTDTTRKARMRHTNSLNLLFCDGHVMRKDVKRGDTLQDIFTVP